MRFKALTKKEAASAEQQTAPGGPADRLVRMAEEYKAAKLLHDEMEKEVKEVGKKMLALSASMAELVEISGLQPPIRLASGGTVNLVNDVSVKQNDPDALMHWLAENGHEDAIKETVHPQTLKSIVKELEQQNKALPDCVTVTEFKRAQFRK